MQQYLMADRARQIVRDSICGSRSSGVEKRVGCNLADVGDDNKSLSLHEVRESQSVKHGRFG